MTAVIARIACRYIAGALIAKGFLDAGTGEQLATDPDVLMLVGAGLGLAAEGFYVVARKLGWEK